MGNTIFIQLSRLSKLYVSKCSDHQRSVLTVWETLLEDELYWKRSHRIASYYRYNSRYSFFPRRQAYVNIPATIWITIVTWTKRVNATDSTYYWFTICTRDTRWNRSVSNDAWAICSFIMELLIQSLHRKEVHEVFVGRCHLCFALERYSKLWVYLFRYS